MYYFKFYICNQKIKTMRYFFALFVMVGYSFTYAQSVTPFFGDHVQPNLRLGDALTELLKKPTSSIDLKGVNGSPFYHESYVFAEVGPDKLSVRYNANTGDFETPGDRYIIPVEGMVVKTKNNEWHRKNDKWLISLGNDIYMLPIKKYSPGRPAKNSMTQDIAPAFRALEVYYQLQGSSLIEIKKRKARKLIK